MNTHGSNFRKSCGRECVAATNNKKSLVICCLQPSSTEQSKWTRKGTMSLLQWWLTFSLQANARLKSTSHLWNRPHTSKANRCTILWKLKRTLICRNRLTRTVWVRIVKAQRKRMDRLTMRREPSLPNKSAKYTRKRLDVNASANSTMKKWRINHPCQRPKHKPRFNISAWQLKKEPKNDWIV